MKFLLFLLIACSEVSAPLPAPREVQSKRGIIMPPSYAELEAEYWLQQGSCIVKWDVSRARDTASPHTDLRNRTHCPDSFAHLAETHRRVIMAILKDFPANTIRGVHTGGLRTINPTGDWNKILADASRKSNLWQDYRKNYPRHASKLSSNDILVSLAQGTKPYAPFTEMLSAAGLKVELEGVEKVFNDRDPQTGLTVIDDAGSFWWKALP